MSQILQMPGVPETSKQLLVRLLQEDLIPVEALKAVVESYRRVIHEAARRNGRANGRLGDQIADALQALLARVNETTGADNLQIIQAAVRPTLRLSNPTYPWRTPAAKSDSSENTGMPLSFSAWTAAVSVG